MTVEDLTEEQIAAVEEIHAESGFDYRMPADLNTPLFPIKRAVINDAGELLAAAAVKVEAEAFLFVSEGSGSPLERLRAIQTLQADLADKARTIGFESVHAAIPPEIAERFGKRLEDMGWKLARPWPIYVYQLR